jgi:hypothetical protein
VENLLQRRRRLNRPAMRIPWFSSKFHRNRTVPATRSESLRESPPFRSRR